MKFKKTRKTVCLRAIKYGVRLANFLSKKYKIYMDKAFSSSVYYRYLSLFNDENKEVEDKFSGLIDALFKLLAIAFGAAVLLVCLNIVIHLLGIPFGALNAGTFGDFLGGVLNPILAFLTFIGLIFTIIIQRKKK